MICIFYELLQGSSYAQISKSKWWHSTIKLKQSWIPQQNLNAMRSLIMTNLWFSSKVFTPHPQQHFKSMNKHLMQSFSLFLSFFSWSPEQLTQLVQPHGSSWYVTQKLTKHKLFFGFQLEIILHVFLKHQSSCPQCLCSNRIIIKF